VSTDKVKETFYLVYGYCDHCLQTQTLYGAVSGIYGTTRRSADRQNTKLVTICLHFGLINHREFSAQTFVSDCRQFISCGRVQRAEGAQRTLGCNQPVCLFSRPTRETACVIEQYLKFCSTGPRGSTFWLFRNNAASSCPQENSEAPRGDVCSQFHANVRQPCAPQRPNTPPDNSRLVKGSYEDV